MSVRIARRERPIVLAVLVLAAGLAPRTAGADGPSPRFEKRWFYAAQNLLVDRNADDLIALIERGGKAGYNGVLLADYKFNLLDRMPPRYFENVARVRAAADRARVEIIPAVFPIGYSDGLLAHDPNLAEGFPVESAPFVVRGREAVPIADPSAVLVNGDLEKTKGEKFAGFSYQDDPGTITFVDRQVFHDGAASCRMEDFRSGSNGNARLIQRVKVRPHACYRLSCWAKTEALAAPGAFHLTAIGVKPPGRPLTFHEGKLAPTQDWTQLDVVFNSLDEAEVNLYLGLWGTKSGRLWIDGLALEELSLVNILRRPGCPLVVASADGRTVYEEGRDFEPIADPKLGVVPYAGLYDFAHAGPPIRLTGRSRIEDGAALVVSWYHPVPTHGDQMMCCLSEPKVYDLLRDQARRVNDLLHPSTFFMSHDEIRVANHCRACRDRKLTPGALLADNTRRCVAILKEIRTSARVATWSDMYDPNHNAVDEYYLVDGTLKGSWEGLPADVIVANWNGGKADASLRWFAGRGHPQILAGYYDGDDLSSFRMWDKAAEGVPKVLGFMYTTWEHRYGLLEDYGRALLVKP